jgi:hypothetical protein
MKILECAGFCRSFNDGRDGVEAEKKLEGFCVGKFRSTSQTLL